MEPIQVKGLLQEKISKKGTKYIALDVYLTPTFTKTVFLDPADVEVVKMYLENLHLKNETLSEEY